MAKIWHYEAVSLLYVGWVSDRLGCSQEVLAQPIGILRRIFLTVKHVGKNDTGLYSEMTLVMNKPNSADLINVRCLSFWGIMGV